MPAEALRLIGVSANEPLLLHIRLTRPDGTREERSLLFRLALSKRAVTCPDRGNVTPILILIRKRGSRNLYWSLGEPILVRFTIYIGRDVDLYKTVAESPVLCLES